MDECDSEETAEWELSGRGRGEGGSSGEAAPVLRFNHTHRRISQRRVRLPDGRNQVFALSDLKNNNNTTPKTVETRRKTRASASFPPPNHHQPNSYGLTLLSVSSRIEESSESRRSEPSCWVLRVLRQVKWNYFGNGNSFFFLLVSEAFRETSRSNRTYVGRFCRSHMACV